MTSAEFRIAASVCAISLFTLLLGCGGGSGSKSSSGSSSSNNTQAVVVNAGPNGNYANGLFTTVMVCAPGTSNCQSISGVLVDTGSYGLRVLSSVLTVPLTQQNDAGGNPVVECAQFADGVIWGPVKTADVKIAGEQASGIPIQVIGDPAFPTVPPSACTAHGRTEDTLAILGTNGILGIGTFIQDCGAACATGSPDPGFYYGCAGSSCTIIAESGPKQVQNPVAFFATDNNGVLVQLPAVSASTATVSGSLIFGIGTRSNNGLGSAQVFAVNPSSGNFTTTFKGKAYSASFIDSGSNAYFFPDIKTNINPTGLPTCLSPDTGFYCPSSATSLTATNSGFTGSPSSSVTFTIDDATTLFKNSADSVFPTLGGPNSGGFDWGLPFFYGHNVFTAIETRSTPGGTGPYWAY